MSRITQCFDTAHQNGKCLLIPFIAAGDPDLESTVSLMHALVAAGADIIELGVPFSDPIADGKVIQAAYQRALRHNVSLKEVLESVRMFRQDNQEVPVVLMGYQNPIEAMGLDTFVRDSAHASVDGVLVVDLPIEEATESITLLKKQGIDPIFLLSPTTPESRIKKVCAVASGFVYYVSLKGVTGSTHLDIQHVRQQVEMIAKQTPLPVGVGFGIQNAQEAAAVSDFASAVIVGSTLVQIIGDEQLNFSERKQKVSALVASMRTALDERHTMSSRACK